MSLHICFFQIYDLKVLRNRTFPSHWLHLGADSTQRSSRFRILPFWLLKKASLKDCDMKTNEDRKLPAILFNIWRGRGAAACFFACLVNYFTVLNCSRWNYIGG